MIVNDGTADWRAGGVSGGLLGAEMFAECRLDFLDTGGDVERITESLREDLNCGGEDGVKADWTPRRISGTTC